MQRKVGGDSVGGRRDRPRARPGAASTGPEQPQAPRRVVAGHRLKRLGRAVVVTAVLAVHTFVPGGAASAAQERPASPAAVVAQVSVTPDSVGMPGGALAQKLLNWTSQVALWGSLLSLLAGATVWGFSQHMGNGMHAGRGRAFAMAGAVGALLAGLAPSIINTLFGAAR